MNSRQKKTIQIIVSVLIFVAVTVSIVSWDFMKNGPKAEQIKNDLEREFGLILPQSAPVSRDASSKPRKVVVGASYLTDLNFQNIREHYDVEMPKHGWEFHDQEQLGGGKGNFGGLTIHYCKGEYTATLYYAGDKATSGWNYSLEVSWGYINANSVIQLIT